MNGATTELADLGFLVDELQLEHDVARRAECARQVYLHAHRGADLSQYVARLLTVQSSDRMTMRQTGWALAAHAYRTADAELVRRLLTGPHRLALLQLDHRAKVELGPIAVLAAHAAEVSGADRQVVFTALSRLGSHGADTTPLIPVLLESLAEKPSGRGFKRVDLAAAARHALVTLLREQGEHRAALVAELTRRAAGNGVPAKAARAVLDLAPNG